MTFERKEPPKELPVSPPPRPQIALHRAVGPALRRAFADPAIRKVFHACDGVDLPRLQRDFGIFVVNVADTQIAARYLGWPLGLAPLLARAGFLDGAQAARLDDLKRRFQNCDWRRRPLSPDAVEYAAGDARHLLALDAYLGRALRAHAPPPPPPPGEEVPAGPDDVVAAAFRDSQRRTLALWRPPRSAAASAKRDRFYAGLDADARERFVALYEWRDAAARLHDESPHAVCAAAALQAFAKRPKILSRDALLLAFDPLPPLLAVDYAGLAQDLLAHLRIGAADAGPPGPS